MRGKPRAKAKGKRPNGAGEGRARGRRRVPPREAVPKDDDAVEALAYVAEEAEAGRMTPARALELTMRLRLIPPPLPLMGLPEAELVELPEAELLELRWPILLNLFLPLEPFELMRDLERDRLARSAAEEGEDEAEGGLP